MYYSDQTLLAIENFGKSNLPHKVTRAYAEVKKACILAIQNTEGFYESIKFDAIIEAIDEIIQGMWDEEFVVPLKQGGAGTSINMNVNEVIANRAEEILFKKYNVNEKVNPLNDINRYQSTNDTFPAAITIVFLRDLYTIEKLTIEVQQALVEREKQYTNTLIMGRTELQDALPMTLNQVFSSWAGMFERDRWRLHKLKERIRIVPIGGTAIGTSFSAPVEYVYKVELFLKDITKLPLCRSQNLPDSISNHDDYSELALGYKLLANNIQKMTEDFLLYTSSICREMVHPELQYGSTIMPNKVNPVLLEWVKGLCLKIKHLANLVNDYNVEGNFQLNAFLPFILEVLLEITELLTKALVGIKKFIEIVIINEDKMKENIDNSKAIFNLLLPIIGYEKTKNLLKELQNLNDFDKVIDYLTNIGIDHKIISDLKEKKLTGFIRNINRS